MKGASIFCGTAIVGMIGTATALNHLALAATLTAITASVIVMSIGILIYIYREWRLKLAYTPLFLESVSYFYFQLIGYPSTLMVEYLFTLLGSLGIITLAIYVWWNRRERYVSQKEAKAKNQSSRGQTQEKANAKEEKVIPKNLSLHT
jgi:hypothetical protein